MTPEVIFILVVAFLYGIVIGSFLNVVIYRIPKKESLVTKRSHCMSCGYQLRWYDLVPLFSYIFLGGRCRKCRAKISAQYPIIEGTNGVLYVLIFLVNGINLVSVLYCLLASALLALSVIDFRIYEIPFGINVFILALGLIRLLMDLPHFADYLIGLFAVSVFLEILLLLSKGRAIGGGDVKLMAACGLLIGWQNIILAFFLGCLFGSVIHIARMKIAGADRVLAMGPYLSMGVMIAALFGNQMINWYLSFF